MMFIDEWMASHAEGERMTEGLDAKVDDIIATAGSTPDDLFRLIAWAHGCHTVAESRRLREDHGHGMCFHYLGQTLLQKAVEMLAGMAVSSLHRIGETRH